MSSYYNRIAERSAFFAKRVEFYAKIEGLSNEGVVTKLQLISIKHGNQAVTKIIDLVVPEELHSSRVPNIKKKDYEMDK